ncbi:MAG TPA: PRC-barrel domain-containing protein [Candidatus Nanoarchaeia archaeon]|nr:PRC-barrel domain-containing protein [Candidatus Nanoarchaeia archaeon]
MGKHIDKYIENSLLLKETRNAHDVVGLRVLTVSGEVLGKVKEVRLNPTTAVFEGVVVNRGLFRAPCYMCKRYIEKITNDAVLLGIEPVLLYVGCKVISSDGKEFGKVRQVRRVNQTNDIESLLVKRTFFRKATIPFSQVKKLGSSIVIKKTFAEASKRGA